MANLGIHVNEQATAVSTPVVANSGIPFVVGLAPGHCASNPAKANLPVLCTSWAEAVEKLKKVNRLELTCGFSIRTFTKKRGF